MTQAIVDCAVYTDGSRLPGTLTPNAAFAKVHELKDSEVAEAEAEKATTACEKARAAIAKAKGSQ